MTCAVGYDLGRRVGNLHPGRAATRGLLESGLIMACGDHMILDVEAIKVIESLPRSTVLPTAVSSLCLTPEELEKHCRVGSSML